MKASGDDLVNVPGWTTTFADTTLESEVWDRKEDLLQLHHSKLNRVADLGWYGDRFTVFVFQDDFQGRMLAQRDANDQTQALALLRRLLETFAAE